MPRNSYPVMRAKTVDALQQQINHFFGGGQILDLPDGEKGLDAKGDVCKLSKTQIWCCSYGVPIKFEFAKSDYFRLQYRLSKSAAILVNRERIPITKDMSCVLPTDVDTGIGEYGAGYEQMTLRVLAKNLEEKIVALTGSPVNHALKFDLMVNLATPASLHLRRMTEFLTETLDSVGTDFPGLAMAELEQALQVAFLCANRHNYSHLLERQPSDGAPWQVRRAEEYIEANWGRPISVEDIASATGASARSVFRAFKKSRGYSPLAFAKLVRLRHAQCMLNLADAATTVTNVAFTCGFSDLSHFSKDYLRTFGESPSHALNRSKGAGSGRVI